MLDPLTRYYLRDAGNRGPLVLMYHAIDLHPGPATSPWVIPLRMFLEHLDLLHEEHFHVVPLDDVVNETAGPRSVCITFDDGYEDNLPAAEALNSRGMTASWFVVSSRIGKRSDWGDSDLAARPMMSAPQLRTLVSDGMTVGSHTVSHPRLTGLDASAQQSEIETSRQQLADVLGSPPAYFAYPYGLFTEQTEKAVMAAGYLAALSTRSGYHRGPAEQFRMRRITVFGQDTRSILARKLALADNNGRWGHMFGMLRGGVARRFGRLAS